MSAKSSRPGGKVRIAEDSPLSMEQFETIRTAISSGALTLGEILEFSEEQIQMFLDHGIRLFRTRKFEEARSALELVLTLSPHHAEGWRAFGALMQETEQFEEAVYAYNLALIHAPEDAVAMMYKGQALLRLDRRDEAIQFLKKGIELGAKDGALEPWVQRSRAVLAAALARNEPRLAVAGSK